MSTIVRIRDAYQRRPLVHRNLSVIAKKRIFRELLASVGGRDVRLSGCVRQFWTPPGQSNVDFPKCSNPDKFSTVAILSAKQHPHNRDRLHARHCRSGVPMEAAMLGARVVSSRRYIPILTRGIHSLLQLVSKSLVFSPACVLFLRFPDVLFWILVVGWVFV